jgi:molecular chaperone GrpE
MAKLTAERDEYLDALQRVKAEFDNFKRRTEREREVVATNATARMASELLAVLDSCEAALEQGAADVEPIYKSLVEVLSKEGLEVMAGSDVPFDPHLHEAVTHEPAEPGDDSAATVVETLRTGYAWNGQVLRPAMVRVRG